MRVGTKKEGPCDFIFFLNNIACIGLHVGLNKKFHLYIKKKFILPKDVCFFSALRSIVVPWSTASPAHGVDHHDAIVLTREVTNRCPPTPGNRKGSLRFIFLFDNS